MEIARVGCQRVIIFTKVELLSLLDHLHWCATVRICREASRSAIIINSTFNLYPAFLSRLLFFYTNNPCHLDRSVQTRCTHWHLMGTHLIPPKCKLSQNITQFLSMPSSSSNASFTIQSCWNFLKQLYFYTVEKTFKFHLKFYVFQTNSSLKIS